MEGRLGGWHDSNAAAMITTQEMQFGLRGIIFMGIPVVIMVMGNMLKMIQHVQ
jgi:hypothetical protein